MTTKLSVYEVVTATIIESLQRGVIPWRQTWTAGLGFGAHKNLTTQKAYNGINALNCTMIGHAKGYDSPYWLSVKQAEPLGAVLKAGEKYVPILYFAFRDKSVNGASVPAEKSTDDNNDSKLIPFARFSQVYNARQFDNLRLPEKLLKANVLPLGEFKPHDRAEQVLTDQECLVIKHDLQKAFYAPKEDFINLPKQQTFESEAAYYHTAFHELGHWSGHENRLSRTGITDKQQWANHEYSKEELIAELTAAFLLSHSGLSCTDTTENTAAYCASWLKVLSKLGETSGAAKLIVSAASQATKAADYLLGKNT